MSLTIYYYLCSARKRSTAMEFMHALVSKEIPIKTSIQTHMSYFPRNLSIFNRRMQFSPTHVWVQENKHILERVFQVFSTAFGSSGTLIFNVNYFLQEYISVHIFPTALNKIITQKCIKDLGFAILLQVRQRIWITRFKLICMVNK